MDGSVEGFLIEDPTTQTVHSAFDADMVTDDLSIIQKTTSNIINAIWSEFYQNLKLPQTMSYLPAHELLNQANTALICDEFDCKQGLISGKLEQHYDMVIQQQMQRFA